MDQDRFREIAFELEGTCFLIYDSIQRKYELKMEEEEFMDKMLSQELELCPNCHWWVRSWELRTEADKYDDYEEDEDMPDDYDHEKIIGCEGCV